MADSDTEKQGIYALAWVILYVWDLSRKGEFRSYDEIIASQAPQDNQRIIGS